MKGGIHIQMLIIDILKTSTRYLSILMKLLKKSTKPGLIIFAYKGVTKNIGVTKLCRGDQIAEAVFEKHCRVISSHFRSCHIGEFLDEAFAHKNKINVLLSFEGVYHNVFTTALPLLEEYRLKFLLFPHQDYVNGSGLFWLDKARLIFSAVPFAHLSVRGKVYDLGLVSTRKRSLAQFEDYLVSLEKGDREALVDELYVKYLSHIQSVFGKILDDLRPIDGIFLQRLKNHKLCRVGSYLDWQALRSSCSREHIEHELVSLRQWHRKVFEEPIYDICYPNGKTNAKINEAAKNTGFSRGFVLDSITPRKVAQPNGPLPPFFLINRYQLHPHDTLDSILGKASGFYDPFLKYFPWL